MIQIYKGDVYKRQVLDEADITNVAVLPSHRKKGIAGKLLKQLLEEAKKQNLHSIYLEVRASNIAAVTLYEMCIRDRSSIMY